MTIEGIAIFSLAAIGFILGYLVYLWMWLGKAVDDPSFTAPHKLWLDDLRPAPSDEWVTCKTAWEAIQYLDTHYVAEISLDHDLGPAYAGTGYDVITHIERKAFNGKLVPKKISLHTANPVGRDRMKQVITSIDRWREARGPKTWKEVF